MNSKQSNKFALTVHALTVFDITSGINLSLVLLILPLLENGEVLLLPLLNLVLLLLLLRHWQVCLLSPLLVSCCSLKERSLGECVADLLHLQLVLPVVVAALEIVTCS